MAMVGVDGGRLRLAAVVGWLGLGFGCRLAPVCIHEVT